MKNITRILLFVLSLCVLLTGLYIMGFDMKSIIGGTILVAGIMGCVAVGIK